MKKVIICGTAVLALGAAPAIAQQPGSQQAGSSQANPAHQFVMEAAMGGMAEVELGKLATAKAQSQEVKQFAQRMVTDHGKANEELKSLAQRKNIALPTDSGAHHENIHEQLSKMSGAAFDRAYMQAMLTDHQKDVNNFRRESQTGTDPEVKAWAAKTLPTLEEHLRMAQSASRGVVGTSGSSNPGSDADRTPGGSRGTTGGSSPRDGSGSDDASGGSNTPDSRGTTGSPR